MASFPGVLQLTSCKQLSNRVRGSGSEQVLAPEMIGLALSKDGVDFTKEDGPILIHNKRKTRDIADLDTSWERQAIGTPSLWEEGDTKYLFYHGYGRAWDDGPDDCQLGLAIGTDLRDMARHPGSPPCALRVRAGTWDCGTIGKTEHSQK